MKISIDITINGSMSKDKSIRLSWNTTDNPDEVCVTNYGNENLYVSTDDLTHAVNLIGQAKTLAECLNDDEVK